MSRITLALLAFVLPLSAFAADEPDADFSEAALLEAVEEYAPDRYQRLIELRETNPERYERALVTVAEKLQSKQQLKSDFNNQNMEMKGRLTELSAQHAQANEQEQARIRAEMVALNSELFDLQMEAKYLHLANIQARVERMETSLQKRETNRAEIINTSVDETLAGNTK